MKKLYKKGTVHPSPQIKSDDHLLQLLPVAIFSLAVVLSQEDRQVLAYLISTATDQNSTSRLNTTKPHEKARLGNHSPLFQCHCFSCYTSYWVRWDSSPNRQLIHEIIDAYEDSLEKKKQGTTKKKDRRKRLGKRSLALASPSFGKNDSESLSQVTEAVGSSCACSSSSKLVDDGTGGCNGGLESTEEHGSEEAEQEEVEGKGSVRRFVSFIGEKVFGVWG